MRTTIDLDNDALIAAKEIARAENTSLGKVISRLVRQALTGTTGTTGTTSAPATHALAQAGAAQSQAQRTQIEAQCTAAVKALVALTALDEDTLRRRLAAGSPGKAPGLSQRIHGVM